MTENISEKITPWLGYLGFGQNKSRGRTIPAEFTVVTF